MVSQSLLWWPELEVYREQKFGTAFHLQLAYPYIEGWTSILELLDPSDPPILPLYMVDSYQERSKP